MRQNLLKHLFAVIALVFSTSVAFSQGVTTSSMQGLVADKSGETLPGANVVAVHTPSGTRYGAVTNAEGRFFIPNVRVGGPYTVTVSYVGFEERVFEGINLALGQNFNINAVLSDGMDLETVEISASRGGIFDADRTGAGLNLGSEKINSLPTINRNVNDFTRLTPQSNGNSFAGTSSRFNNFTLDGNILNNNFGLGNSQFAGGNPISIDAIEEIQVNLAPYDVRQGGFTGAGVNAVTRSGDNTYRGSVYYFLRNDQMRANRVRDTFVPQNNARNEIRGFRLGGPIIKDKLFFFANYEEEEELRPSILRRARRPGETPDGQFISRVPIEQANFVRENMISIYGYDPGEPDSYAFGSQQTRLNLRLDYNINQNNKLFIRYNRFSSFEDVPTNASSTRNISVFSNTSRTGVEAINFRNANYTNDRLVETIAAELNTKIGNNAANQLNIGYTSIADPKRGIPGGQAFPFIEVLEPNEAGELQYYMSLGNELFSVGNLLENKIFNITNNFTLFKGKHTYTFGGNFEFFTFDNAFNPVFNGHYRFIGYDRFVDAVINRNPNVFPDAFAKSFALDGSTTPPTDRTRFGQLGFYVQDEYQVNSKLKVTGGLRVDLPFYPISIPRNELLEARGTTFTLPNGETLIPDVSVFPKVNPLFSPRIGFNYDVNGDRSFVLRGGTGVFSGRLPFVWLSNQVNGSGVIRGIQGFEGQQVINQGIIFNPDVTAYNPTNPSQTLGTELALTDRNFRLPQTWRTSFGVDKQLPFGIVGSFDFIYSRDLSAPVAQNIVNREPDRNWNGPDQRPIWVPTPGFFGPSSDPFFRQVFYLTNADANPDYISGTVSLSKSFNNGFDIMAAYTMSRARDLDATGGSQAQSLVPTVVAENRNKPTLSFANFDQPHRIISTVSYTTENTTISLFYEGGPNGRFSYTIANGGGLNTLLNIGDGQARLVYVPNSASELNFQPFTLAGRTVTAEEQARAFDAFIDQDRFLRNARGRVFGRNEGIQPWVHTFDLSVAQRINITNDKKNKLEARFDFLNFGNLLNPNWGVPFFPWQTSILNYRGTNAAGEPVYRITTNPGTTTIINETFRPTNGIGSLWRMQVGLRYNFN
ncbi:TonB-dependent receptor [Cecembia rubra]|uniref:Carboxypeptidase family protein n=1 Tax=Cecembia rubra TaxID=1485585 RepID=A0A2P8E0F4_9BACT|nr:carboxypeptidase regulatory-like domain-containing protein [Cecembia rubra]PSL02940.1 carboxypeptidase family protein [Cecembia rubra]